MKVVYTADLAAWCGIRFGNDAANPFHNGALLYVNGEPVTDLVIPNGVEHIGAYSFANALFLESVVIPEGVDKIGEGAFKSCENLMRVSIADGVTHLGKSVFYGCKKLATVTIPESVITIREEAFYCCENLTAVTMPENVARIEEWAFYGCTRLSTVYIRSKDVVNQLITKQTETALTDYAEKIYIEASIQKIPLHISTGYICVGSETHEQVDYKAYAKDHNWNDGEVTDPPTYLALGIKIYTCTACNETKKEILQRLNVIATDPEEKNFGTGAIVGIAAGGAAVVGGGVAACLWFARKKKKTEE